MEKEFKKEFKSCPVCKSKNKFCAELGKEIKKRGLTTKGWAFCYESRSGITMDKAAPVPLVGTTLPGFIIIVDICMDCGCVYASKIERRIQCSDKNHLQEKEIVKKGEFSGRINRTGSIGTVKN